MEYKKRSDVHWARKIWHMGGVSLILLLYVLAPPPMAILAILGAWAICIPIDLARQRNPQLNEFLVQWFKPIIRDHEVHRLAGTSYLLTGVGFVAVLCPREVTILTLLYLAFADPLASFVGIKWGRDKILGNKSLQGSVAAFLVCTLATFFFLYSRGLLLDHLFVVSLSGGLIGCLAELIPIGRIDDNFTLPVVSAGSLWALFSIFGLFANLSAGGGGGGGAL
ncbi:MAG: hypothetical protein C5B49_15595 [Bdellovibrio sp.]|nr:MAG: hypothetical protein C5B49_15595 [Bdellovibrio sp.]